MSKDQKSSGPSSGQPAYTFNFSACSDRGLVRGNNEDSAYAGPRLLALADGMGGHAAGEVASQFLVNSLRPLDSPLLDEPDMQGRLTTLMATAMDEGNQAISAHVDANPQLEGMGCTLSTVLMRGEDMALCHVGDSRGYILRDGELQQITKDDTFVQSLVDEGRLDPEEVSGHPQRSLILKALTGRPVDPTLTMLQVRPGDRVMLCSDGLSDPVSFDTIQETLSTGTPDQSARRLVELALRSGGPDNVTVVIGDVVELDAERNLPLDPTITLPATPLLAGAVAGGKTDEGRRPDTAASRAAALNLQTINRPAKPVPEVHEELDSNALEEGKAAQGSAGSDATKEPAKIAPNSPVAVSGSGAEKGRSKKGRAEEDKHTKQKATRASNDSTANKKQPKKKRTGLIISLVVVLVVLAGLAGGAYLLWKDTKNSYYVADSDEQIFIYNGKRDSILGQTFNSTYQEVCLSENNKITLFSPGDAPKKGGQECHRFSTNDLTPVARGAISDLPDGNYDEVVAQLKRLSDRTLPVCVERKSSTRAPEDLTTPGVSCREVK